MSLNNCHFTVGGTFCSLEDKVFSHVVLEDSVQEIPDEAKNLPHVKVVKQEVVYAVVRMMRPKVRSHGP